MSQERFDVAEVRPEELLDLGHLHNHRGIAVETIPCTCMLRNGQTKKKPKRTSETSKPSFRSREVLADCELGIFEGMIRGRDLERFRHLLADVVSEEDRIRLFLWGGMVDVDEVAGHVVHRTGHDPEEER